MLHPCFNEKAMNFGRMHLPVAPKCNIKCNYCPDKRTKICAYERIISCDEAVNIATKLIAKDKNIKVVGVAGPGDPLFNEETFTTLKSIKVDGILKCLCTNGLLLPEKVSILSKIGVKYITITINAVNPKIGARIYSLVRYNGKRLRGEEAAKVLIENQLEGLRLASRKMVVKVNSVLIPSINDEHLVDVAREIEDYAYIQNIIPLIPQYKFSNIHPPDCKLVESVRNKCEKFVKQMRHCSQCRADAVGKLWEKNTIFHIREFNSSNVKTLGFTR